MRARDALESVLGRASGGAVRVGRVSFIGTGLSRDIYAADVEAGATRRTCVALLPRDDAPEGLLTRARRELGLLRWLEDRSRRLPGPGGKLRIPHPVGLDEESGTLVREWVDGLPLELRAGRQSTVPPWDVVASVAAAIHAIAGVEVKDLLPGHETRRDHAWGRLAELEGAGEPELRALVAWGREHLPPATPSRLVHGDLLGQNILRDLDGGPPGVIDWEYAQRGDPAYDLAIVSRGRRRPFDVPDGLRRLLDAYNAGSPEAVEESEVRLHEGCLLGTWYAEALAGTPTGRPAEHERAPLAAFLRRLGA